VAQSHLLVLLQLGAVLEPDPKYKKPILDVRTEGNASDAVDALYAGHGEVDLPEGFEHFELVVRTRSGYFKLAIGIKNNREECKLLDLIV